MWYFGYMFEIKISVRKLVEFILRSGDIDKKSGLPDTDAMLMGSRIHRKLQKSAGPEYEAEVFLSETFCYPEGFSVRLEGRADGIITGKDGITIDEIKSLMMDVDELEEPVPVHEAQAKCYAFMYLAELARESEAAEISSGKRPGAKRSRLESITVQMTYVSMETEKIRRFSRTYTRAALEEWFYDILSKYRVWAAWLCDHRRRRNLSIRKLKFPYPYREGQQKLVAAVYRTIEQKKKLFIQAPTGSGKTLATVYPAVRALGEGMGDRIFYLTAKTVARTVAREAFSILEGEGLEFGAVTITAKEKVCFLIHGQSDSETVDAEAPGEAVTRMAEDPQEAVKRAAKDPQEAVKRAAEDSGETVTRTGEMRCDPEDCPYARGHFDRINDAVYEMLTEGGSFGREDILAQAKRRRVCPYELTLDLTMWLDGVICDYNYLFDPNARLQRFFSDQAKTDSIFLIDEAHNLVDRGRGMYSAALYKEDFLELKKELKKKNMGKALMHPLDTCNKWMLERKKQLKEDAGAAANGSGRTYRQLPDAGTLILHLMTLSARMEKFIDESRDEEMITKVRELWFRVMDFLGASDRADEKYITYTEILSDGRTMIRIFCVDPSSDLEACMSQGRASVLFSATLLPMGYYIRHLSERSDDYAIYATSCFDTKKRLLLIGGDVSTRYTMRGHEMYERIAQYILMTVSARAGNYMVFFPSYRMMEDVHDIFALFRPSSAETILQHSRMSEAEREDFLERFRTEAGDGKTLVGFCVMGSFFAEGIDLRKEALIGAVIVGCGLPQVCTEQEILQNWYRDRGQDGFRYAYAAPGMNRVQQAAGRVIRTQSDCGVIVLLDERFQKPLYRGMFPPEWADAKACLLGNVEEQLTSFWQSLNISADGRHGSA